MTRNKVRRLLKRIRCRAEGIILLVALLTMVRLLIFPNMFDILILGCMLLVLASLVK